MIVRRWFASFRGTLWWSAALATLLLACRIQIVDSSAPLPANAEASAAASPASAAGVDTTPPTLVRVSSPAEVWFGDACGAPSLAVQVRAQDDAGPPAQVWLEYAYGEPRGVRRLPLALVGGDEYAGQIPVGQEAPQMLPQGGNLYYRVWVEDAAGHRTAAPGPSAWFSVGVLSCVGDNGTGGASGAAAPPFAPSGPSGGGGQPGGASPGSPNAPGNPPPAAPPPSSPPGGAGQPGGTSPGNPNPPGGQPPAGNPGHDEDLPVICYPDCEGGGDDVVDLPPEAQPDQPPGDVVFDPDDIGDIGGNDPGAPPGGNDPAQPPAQPGTLVVVNQSSFPVVSLAFMYDDPNSGQRKQEDVILGMHQVIVPGGSLTVSDLEPGVAYSVMPGIGFWDATGRTITGYLAPQMVQVQPGERASMTISDPSAQELLTQFGTVTRYKGFVMGGSPVASYCAYLDVNGNGYALTIVHENGQTVLSDSGTWRDTYFSVDLGFITLQFDGQQTSFEGNYHFKGPEIGALNLMNVNVPGQGMFPFIEMRGNSNLCP